MLMISSSTLADNHSAPNMPHQVPFDTIREQHNPALVNPRSPDDLMIAAGLRESTLIPVYPTDAQCYEIDHIFGEVWKGPTDTRHSGADIPAPWDYPIHAMADGTVIAKFDGQGSGGRTSRGIQIVLQHTPEQTGLPIWIYTLYSHFKDLPNLEIGAKVKQGDYLGPNGKTGVPGRKREPHLHLTVNISPDPEYAIRGSVVVPKNGVFIDPVALFRGKLPLDTASMQALPDAQKPVSIAYRKAGGDIFPKGAKIIWPMDCN